MRRGDMFVFARHDWSAIEENKAVFWSERKRSMSPAEALVLGDGLRPLLGNVPLGTATHQDLMTNEMYLVRPEHFFPANRTAAPCTRSAVPALR